jgi:hypothetical protein
MDLLLFGDVSYYAVRAGLGAGDAFDAFAMAGYESDARPVVYEVMDEGEAQAGSAAGNGDSQAGERIIRLGHRNFSLCGGVGV